MIMVDDSGSSASDHFLELRPLKHQVGGHGSLLELGNQFICKPFSENEFNIYSQLLQNSNLRSFIPNFYGVVNTNCESESDERLMMRVKRADSKVSTLLRRCRRVTADDVDNKVDCDGRVRYRLQGSTNEHSSNPINPWAKECFSRHVRKFKDIDERKYIVLENLTTKLTHPNVLDLKLGTRTYSDWATAEKKARMEARCRSSTSRDLGLRVGGMQIYNDQTGEYSCWDKYFGRGLTEEGFAATLKLFIDSAPQNVCRKVVEKLLDLRHRLASEAQYRFYSSSLLLIYDGSQTVDVRMIDFANTSCTTDPDSSFDEGYMFGLDNLIALLKAML